MSQVHKDNLAAWVDLQKRGGLELGGRDEGLEEELKNRLAPGAGSLDEALRNTTTNDLVRAFFDVLQPFVAMFHAILEFFEKAGAAEGREQWNIMVDDVDLRLDHFRRYLEKWNSVPCEIEVPAVDFRGAWAITHSTQEMPEMDTVSAGVGSKEQYWSGVVDIDDWLRAYRSEAGHYKEWPQSLAPSSLDPGYSDAAALGLAAVGAIRKTYASRQELIADHRKRHFAMDRADGLSLRTIAQNETDYWLGTLVARLARAQTLPSPAKGVLGKRLQDEFARYSRKKFGARINIADLQAYLSLPVWRKRHELYAVWIATEIVNALPDHVCQIHHEDGKIVFAFRETLLATVKSSWPIVRLISERRVPLDAPVGKGRSGNVQPDYGLWRHEAGVETCGLIIEVKHYKRSASSSFGHVLADYSRAFPKANVYLVNHGPIGDVRKDLPRELSVRCYPVKELTVPNLDARDELRKAVRKYVGEPVARPRRKSDVGKPSVGRPDTVLAIDVSSSMSGQLGKPHFFEIVQEVADEHCGDAALIDVSILAFVPLENLAEAITSTHGSSTGLGEPIRELLRTFKRVVVITDDDGLNSLRQISNRTTISRRLGLLAIEVLA